MTSYLTLQVICRYFITYMHYPHTLDYNTNISHVTLQLESIGNEKLNDVIQLSVNHHPTNSAHVLGHHLAHSCIARQFSISL